MTNRNRVTKAEFILFLGVDVDLFKGYFGYESEWKCRLESLPEDCSIMKLMYMLNKRGLVCVVVQDTEGPLWEEVMDYYQNGGFVVYFGHMGQCAAPLTLSSYFDVEWSFSAYTRHEYELTDVGKQLLGDSITEQMYSKSNLLRVPKEDRILVPKHDYATVEEFIQKECELDDKDAHEKYAKRRTDLDMQVPLAMHNASHGGRIAYLGFVNSGGNIPLFVRALCTGMKTSDA